MSTIPPPTFRAWTLRVLSSSAMKRIGTTLAGAIVFFILWAQTQLVGEKVDKVERKAESAERKVDGAYGDLAPKAAATGDTVERLRQDLDATRAELARALERIDRLAGRRGARRPVPAPVPIDPAVTAPLPETPALAPKENP